MSTSDSEPPSFPSDGSTLSNSFKRSFDQLDVEENTAGESLSPAIAGSDRHKRARSEPRSEAGSSSAPVAESDNLATTLEQSTTIPGPSHMNGEGDVELPSQYEMSMERFSNFEEQMQPLRISPEVTERRSPPLSDNPIDEDEIRNHLFGGPSSSQSSVNNHPPPPSPPPLAPPAVTYAPTFASASSNASTLSTTNGSIDSSEREVLVISDSEDEVQLIERPSQRSTSMTTEDTTNDFRELLASSSDHWSDFPLIPDPWRDSVISPSSSSSTHITPQQSTPQRHGRRSPTLGSSTSHQPSPNEARLSPWGTDSSMYMSNPSSAFSLTMDERNMIMLRQMHDMRRRASQSRHSMERAPEVEAMIHRLRDARELDSTPIIPRGDRVSPVARPPTSMVYDRIGTRVEDTTRGPSFPVPTSGSEHGRSSPEAMRRYIQEASTRTGLSPSSTTTTNTTERSLRRLDDGSAQQTRRSLVMEGLLSANPGLLSNLRPASRSPAPPIISRPISTVATLSTSRPVSPQMNHRNDQLSTTRPPASRPPSWMFTASPLATSESRTIGQSISPSSSGNSSASFVTASSSLDDLDSSMEAEISAVAGAHAPAFASPLRQMFVAAPETNSRSSLARPSARSSVLREDTALGGVDMGDVISRVQSLSGLLTEMTTSRHASAAIRDAASRLITSGEALMAAIDSQLQSGSISRESSSAHVTTPTVNARENTERNIPRPTISTTPTAVTISPSSSSDVLDLNSYGYQSGITVRSANSDPAAGATSTNSRRAQSPSAASVGSYDYAALTTTSYNWEDSRPSTVRTSHNWNEIRPATVNTIGRPSPPASANTTHTSDTIRTSTSLFGNEGTVESRRVAEYVMDEIERTDRARNRINDDRWTQARQRRRELQDALLAEESRLRTLRRALPGDSSSSGRVSRDAQSDSSRMDVDSEDEVERLFNSEVLGDQESMDVRGANNTASRTTLRPPSQRSNPLQNVSAETDRPTPIASPHRVIDLSAYHDGPFRGALARAVEASRQSENRRQQQIRQAARAAIARSPVSSPRSSRSSTSDLPQDPRRDRRMIARDSTPSAPPLQPIRPQSSTSSMVSAARSTASSATENPRRHNVRFANMFENEGLETGIPGVQDLEDDLMTLQRLRAMAEDPQAAHTPGPLLNNRSRGRTLADLRESMRQRFVAQRSNTTAATNTGAGTGGRRYIPPYLEGLTDLSDESIERFLYYDRGRDTRRGVPQDIIDSLEKGTYGEWANAETETSCPICFEDYQASDAVVRLPKCKHWFHKPCIEEWFKTAATCPICRDRIGEPTPNIASTLSFMRGRHRRISPMLPVSRIGSSATGHGRPSPSVIPTPTSFMASVRPMLSPRPNPPSTTGVAIRDTATQPRTTAWREVQQRERLFDTLEDTNPWSPDYDFLSPGTPDDRRRRNPLTRAVVPGPTSSALTDPAPNTENGRGQLAQAPRNGESSNTAARRPIRRRSERSMPSDAWYDEDLDDLDEWI